MSILIKGMEMPKKCDECRFCVNGFTDDAKMPVFDENKRGIKPGKAQQIKPNSSWKYDLWLELQLMLRRREEMQELSDVERSVFITALTSEFGDKEDKDV